MLFSIEKLVELGYPDNRLELTVITENSYATQEKLWNLYKERQTEIAGKTAEITDYISQKSFWWNKEPEAKSAVEEPDAVLLPG